MNQIAAWEHSVSIAFCVEKLDIGVFYTHY